MGRGSRHVGANPPTSGRRPPTMSKNTCEATTPAKPATGTSKNISRAKHPTTSKPAQATKHARERRQRTHNKSKPAQALKPGADIRHQTQAKYRSRICGKLKYWSRLCDTEPHLRQAKTMESPLRHGAASVASYSKVSPLRQGAVSAASPSVHCSGKNRNCRR